MKKRCIFEIKDPSFTDYTGIAKSGNLLKIRVPFSGKKMTIRLFRGGESLAELSFGASDTAAGHIVKDLDFSEEPGEVQYEILSDGKLLRDPYAKAPGGSDLRYGVMDSGTAVSIGPKPDLKDAFVYILHVKGFTMHPSSAAACPGTFEGVAEKAVYLKSIGVNCVELMPCYEFDDRDEIDAPDMTQRFLVHAYDKEPVDRSRRNYWGFKPGYYMMPKISYSGSKDPGVSFSEMVDTLHKAGIAVVMEFTFPKEESPLYIMQIFRYWHEKYMVDGFHLKGREDLRQLLISSPFLQDLCLYSACQGFYDASKQRCSLPRNL